MNEDPSKQGALSVDEYVTATNEVREAFLTSLDADGLLRMGVELFNARQFWHAHEAWEQVWMDASREERAFYQGLIQVAAAFVHLLKREYPGTVKLIDEGLSKLERYGAQEMGIELAELIEATRAMQGRVVGLGPRRLGEIEAGSLPSVRWVGNSTAD